MRDVLTLRALKFMSGHADGLSGPTAVLEMDVAARMPGRVLERLSSTDDIIALNPSDPWPVRPGVTSWAGPFLVGGEDRGDPLAERIAALLVLVQIWGRVPIGPARVNPAPDGQLHIALPWYQEPMTRAAITFVTRHVTALADPHSAFDAAADLAELLSQAHVIGLAPNSMRFAMAAIRRGMPVAVRNWQELHIGWGSHTRRFKSSFTDQTAVLGERLARHKYHCNQRLTEARLPVAPMRFVRSKEEAETAAAEFGWPVVVKPVALDQGQGVHVGVGSVAALHAAYDATRALEDRGILVEKFVPGADHRILVVGNRMMMATRRIPGGVTGDGRRTVAELLERLNADPVRGTDQRSMLIEIPLDGEAMACLKAAGLTAQSVPDAGRFVPLRRTANISTGGTAVDVTDAVHPDNRIAAIRAARVIGLDIAGIDFLSPDISVSFHDNGGVILEVNAQPGFRPHWLSDPDRDINGDILDVLFAGRPARIPTAAITGTNGKSTTAMMLHHVWMTAGRTAGVTTTAGTWVGRDRISMANLSGVPGAKLLLADPAVEAAVLEMPRRGLILYGQACDHYDVAAFLNVQDDHIGQDGIETIDDMARLKAGVILRARRAVVINAEDPRCLEHGRRAAAPRHILVAMDPGTPALADHLDAGGDGVFVARHEEDADWIFMARGAQRIAVIPVAAIPATLNGQLRFNIMNAMFAIALADAQELSGEAIRNAMAGFETSRDMNPGRYNMVEGFAFPLIVDYAHNEVGTSELCRVVQDLPVPGQRILVLRTLGSSGPDEVLSTAKALMSTFGRIHVLPPRTWVLKNRFYKSDDPIGEMLEATRRALLEQGAGEDQVTTSRDDEAVIHQVLQGAGAEDVVVLMSDPDVAFQHIDSFRARNMPGQAAG